MKAGTKTEIQKQLPKWKLNQIKRQEQTKRLRERFDEMPFASSEINIPNESCNDIIGMIHGTSPYSLEMIIDSNRLQRGDRTVRSVSTHPILDCDLNHSLDLSNIHGDMLNKCVIILNKSLLNIYDWGLTERSETAAGRNIEDNYHSSKNFKSTDHNFDKIKKRYLKNMSKSQINKDGRFNTWYDVSLDKKKYWDTSKTCEEELQLSNFNANIGELYFDQDLINICDYINIILIPEDIGPDLIKLLKENNIRYEFHDNENIEIKREYFQ